MSSLPRFHTGLYTSDWHRYPAPPYRGIGWTVDFVQQKSEYPLGGEYMGDQLYPFKKVILSARNQTAAQRALDTIMSARNLLGGSNFFRMLSGDPQVVSPVDEEVGGTSADVAGERPAFHSSPNLPLACLIAAKVSRRLRFVSRAEVVAPPATVLEAQTLQRSSTDRQ